MSKLFEPSEIYRPFHFPWAVDLTVEHEKMHWIESEIQMGGDVEDWKLGRLTEGEKDFVTQILRMFTQQDVDVGGFYYENLIPIFKNNEIRNMLGSFAVREGTHQRAYALLNDTLGLPEGDYAAFLDYVEMNAKHEFACQADVSTKSGLGLSLAKGVFNEGLSLFASFVMLLNFQRRGLMKGMGKIVEWSIKDETKHVEGVAKLFRTMCDHHPFVVTDRFKHAIYDMAREAVKLEDAFIDLACRQGEIEGLSSAEVKQYIRYIADRRLVQLGLKPNFMIEKNPIPWLDWIVSGTDHTNFFEGRVTEYEVGGLQGEWKHPDLTTQFRVYWRHGCQWCDKAKALLTLRGFKFQGIDLTDNDERQRFYNGRGFVAPESRTMPKVYVITAEGEMLVGGYEQLVAFLGEA